MKTKKDFKKLHEKQPKKKSIAKSDNDKIKHLTRLIKLMITLNQGVLNLDNAAQENGVSRRTIQRDIDLLEKAGLPLYKPNPQNVNYRVRDDFEWAKFNITKENALQFADAVYALTKGLGKPGKWVLPIQKEVLETGKKEQKKREEKLKHKWVSTNITDEQFTSIFLDSNNMEKSPYQTMMQALEFEKLNDKQAKDKLYADWQNIEMLRTGVRFNWVNGTYNEALFFCDLLIKKKPEDTWAYKQAALICYAQKKYRKALDYVLDGRKYDQKDMVFYCYMIYFSIFNGYCESAIELFNLACKDEFGRAHFAATIYAKNKLFDKALEVVEKATKKDKDDSDLYESLKEDILEQKKNSSNRY